MTENSFSQEQSMRCIIVSILHIVRRLFKRQISKSPMRHSDCNRQSSSTFETMFFSHMCKSASNIRSRQLTLAMICRVFDHDHFDCLRVVTRLWIHRPLERWPAQWWWPTEWRWITEWWWPTKWWPVQWWPVQWWPMDRWWIYDHYHDLFVVMRTIRNLCESNRTHLVINYFRASIIIMIMMMMVTTTTRRRKLEQSMYFQPLDSVFSISMGELNERN